MTVTLINHDGWVKQMEVPVEWGDDISIPQFRPHTFWAEPSKTAFGTIHSVQVFKRKGNTNVFHEC